jgi:hypothetical protein
VRVNVTVAPANPTRLTNTAWWAVNVSLAANGESSATLTTANPGVRRLTDPFPNAPPARYDVPQNPARSSVTPTTPISMPS